MRVYTVEITLSQDGRDGWIQLRASDTEDPTIHVRHGRITKARPGALGADADVAAILRAVQRELESWIF